MIEEKCEKMMKMEATQTNGVGSLNLKDRRKDR